MIEDQLAALIAGQTRTNELLGDIADVVRRIGDEPDTPDTPAGPGPRGPLTIEPLTGVRIVDVLPIAAGWTLSLPIPKPKTVPADKSPWNDYPDRLDGGTAPGMAYPALVGGRRAVVFEVRDPSAATTTSGSKYPRSELREMVAGGERWVEAARDSAEPFACTAELAIITSGLSTRPREVGWQIHGGDDDVCQVVADEQGRLGVSWRDGKAWMTLREHYDGEFFTLQVDSAGKVGDKQGPIYFTLDGKPAGSITPSAGRGWYIKGGAYLQTGGSSEHREPATAVGRVVYFALDVQPRS